MVEYNIGPYYYALRHLHRKMNGQLEHIPGLYDIFEFYNGETTLICTLSNGGDRLQELLKRGIPMDEARKLFYEMDGV